MITIYDSLISMNEKEQTILTLKKVKDFLRIIGDSDDENINIYINEAIKQAEKICGISISEKQYIASYSKQNIKNNKITLPIRFVKNIIKISLFDNMMNNEKILKDENHDYAIDSMQTILLSQNNIYENVCVTFVATIRSDNLDFPNLNGLKSTILTHINVLYKNRMISKKNNEVNIKMEIENLYSSYRLLGL